MKLKGKYLLLLILLVPQMIFSQSVKLKSYEIYNKSFSYDNQYDRFYQLNHDYETGEERECLISKKIGNNSDSVLLLNCKKNKSGLVYGPFEFKDENGQVILTGTCLNSEYGNKTSISPIYKNYYLWGIKNGIFNYYEINEKGSKYLIRSETYNEGFLSGTTKTYYQESNQIEFLKDYQLDKLHGEYIRYNPDGTFAIKGNYVNGTKHGDWVEYYTNNQMKNFKQYKANLLEGQFKEWHSNGNVATVTNYAADKIHSFYFTYYENKQRKDSSTFANGKPYGTSVTYFENGKLNIKCEYDNNGELHGLYRKWNMDGVLLENIPYEHGIQNGKVFFYFTNGKLEKEFTMKLDTLDGIYKSYYENGKPKSVEIYKMGEIQDESVFYDEKGKKFKVPFFYMDEVFEPLPEPPVEREVEEVYDFVYAMPYIIFTPSKEKNDQKVYAKLKGKEVKIRVDSWGNVQLLLPENNYKEKFRLQADNLFKKDLKVKPPSINGKKFDTTLVLIIE